ncbi:MAG: UDP-glucose/GDP-mannose dehydrogenase family protein [Gammaproteobacteria bacterium]|nr:UDP-glucose/GDP-mannose dehydrogenase family protein [Gammaproteobacteria bacterium]MDH5660224.1 UDP-glucose/GDP-mannose dehydrogenase family protein [Gammaproteobacteria bacterium]
MKIVIVGTGYIGLVTGACFAERGNQVTCVDIDENKIKNLHKGILPIYEPGLEELVKTNVVEERLFFATSIVDVIDGADLVFIAVGTPAGEDGSADLQYVLDVASNIGKHITDYAVIVNKSTVPVGTADKVTAQIQTELDKRKLDISFDVASNPEFLKEGAAIEDFMRPDRVVIGTATNKTAELMHDLYKPFVRNNQHIILMGIRDAEMTKYTANSMLATKISFMNEIANLCDILGVDVENVRQGIGSDSRIGFSYIYPGCGYGGSCFPKDVQALIRTANSVDYDAIILKAVEQRNNQQKYRLFEKIVNRYGTDLSGMTFALWGLAFKPGTDDMREAPSKVILHELIAAGAKVIAYDPIASEIARKELPKEWFNHGHLKLAEHQYNVLPGVDALILVTEWKPFNNPDFEKMKKLMKSHVIFDGRNQYEPKLMHKLGFSYLSIGRDATNG